MKQKTKTESEYIRLVHKNSTEKLPKCINKPIILLLSILLLVAALSCLFMCDNKNILKNSFISSKYQIDIETNHRVDNYCSVTSDEFKFDCFPRGKADKDSCEKRNCCWSPSTENSLIPWCYYPSNYSNYKVVNVTKSKNEIVAFFNITSNTNYKNDIKVLRMDISLQTAQRLRVKVINNFLVIN